MMKRSQGAVILALCLFASILAISRPSFALLCVESCVPEPPPPPEPPPGCQYPVGTATTIQTGSVEDPFGSPIAGAKVHNWCKTTTTNAAGLYSLLVPVADGGRKLIAKGTAHYYREMALPSPVGSVQVKFEDATALPYLVGETITVTPDAVSSLSSQVTFRLDTTAPLSGARVLVQLPAGGRITLAHDLTYASPAGWSRWAATTMLPAGFPLGRQTIYACVLKATAPAADGCFAPESAHLISQVRDHAIAYDQTPPAATTSTPAAFSNVTSAPATISVTIADAGGAVLADGMFPTRLDGQSVAGSRSGDTISLSGAGLAPGVHLVEVDAADTAGNAVTIRTLFTVVTISATDAIARLLPLTLDVNPNGTTPGPSQITFTGLQADIDSFEYRWNATTRVGKTTVARSMEFGAVQVEFRRADGVSTVVAGSVPSSSLSNVFHVLMPSADPLGAGVEATRSAVPVFTVNVPAGFDGQGATASLIQDETPLGPAAFAGDPVVSVTDSPTKAALTMTTCLTATDFCAVNGSRQHLVAYVGGQWIKATLPIEGPTDHDLDVRRDPGCKPNVETDSCGQEPQSGSQTDPYDCPRPRLRPEPGRHCGQSNLLVTSNNPDNEPRSSGAAIGCSGRIAYEQQLADLCSAGGVADAIQLAASYMTPFAYSLPGCLVILGDDCIDQLIADPTPDALAVWVQSHATPGVVQCPEGLPGTIRSTIERVFALFSSGPSYAPRTVGGPRRVEIDGSDGSLFSAGVLAGENFRIVSVLSEQNPASAINYDTAMNRTVSLDGQPTPAAGVASAWWPKATTEPVGTDIQLFAGAEFTRQIETAPLIALEVGAVFALTHEGGCDQ